MAALAARFGPVREVTLNDLDDRHGGEALDLDSGQLSDLPHDISQRSEPEQLQWLKDQSADLLLDNVEGHWGLLTPADAALVLAPLLNTSWEIISESGLSNALAGPPGGVKTDPERIHRVFANNRWEMVRETDLPVAPPPALEVKERGPWRVYVVASNAHPPLTLAFQTARGARGLLEITGFAENPCSMKLRYKRVEPTAGGETLNLAEGSVSSELAGATGLVQVTGFTDHLRGVKLRYRSLPTPGATRKPVAALSEADRARAVTLFNDIEDFGHEFEAAFAATNLAAAGTGVRRLSDMLTNFNAVVQGTDCEFPATLFDDIGKVQQALAQGDWENARRLGRHNEAYAREFRRIGAVMTALARGTHAFP